MKNQFIALCCFLMINVCAFAQTCTESIKGVVTDSCTGIPIPSANVVVKGTQNGTVTNFNGEFTIQASLDAVLVISYLGYVDKEIPINGQTQLKIALDQDVAALDEII